MEAIPLPDPPLTDGVITLRAKREEDLDAITAALQDPEIPRWTRVPSPYTLEIAQEWFVQSEALRLAGEHLNLLTVDAETGALLGSVGLMRDAALPGVGELGYWTAKEARGRGLCVRAVVLLRDWGVATLGLRRVEILVDAENAPSRRVAEKAGFTDTGELRVAPRVEGATEPSHKAYAWDPISAE
jgi:RimJ/RimL family protein N-acetyltransferase